MSPEDDMNAITTEPNGIADRAGWFLDQAHPGPHKNKRVARAFGISPEMAQLLRHGRGWTVKRLEQAAKLFGKSFYQAVFNAGEGTRSNDIAQRVERLESLARSWAMGPLHVGDTPMARDGTADRRGDHRRISSGDAGHPPQANRRRRVR